MRAFLETWRPVRGYEGIYEVSDYGDVRSLNYMRTGKTSIMKKRKKKEGYERVNLSKNGTVRTEDIHRLVWEAFHGAITDGMEIDHINTVRDDNRLANLRAVTHNENNHNPITRERHLIIMRKLHSDEDFRRKRYDGIRKAVNKPVLQLDKDTGEVIREWESATDASLKLGINNSHISACCRGKRNSAGGFRWRFK